MRILLDKITTAGTHFPVALSTNARNTVNIIVADNGGTATVNTFNEATSFGRFTQFNEAPNGTRTDFSIKGSRLSTEDEIIIAKNGSVLTSGYTATGNIVAFTVAPVAGDLFEIFLTRAGSWVNIIASNFVEAGSSAFEFSEFFYAFRTRVSTCTNAKVTATIQGRNK